MNERATILIVGAGPTGLGAAHELHRAGHRSWTLFERDEGAGLVPDERPVTHAWTHRVEHGHPTPTRDRDGILLELLVNRPHPALGWDRVAYRDGGR